VEFRYGPVELYLVGLEGDSPEPRVVDALRRQVAGGALRVLDLLTIHRSADGSTTIEEVDAPGLGLELAELGVTGEEDVADLAELVAPGASAIVVALELRFLRDLAGSLAVSGARVLSTERIPAPVINALVDAAGPGED